MVSKRKKEEARGKGKEQARTCRQQKCTQRVMPDHSADSNRTIDDLDSNSGYKKSNGMSFGGVICLVVI